MTPYSNEEKSKNKQKNNRFVAWNISWVGCHGDTLLSMAHNAYIEQLLILVAKANPLTQK